MYTHYIYEYKCRAKSKKTADEFISLSKSEIQVKSISKDIIFGDCLLIFTSNLNQNEIIDKMQKIDASKTMVDSLEQIIDYH